MKRTFLIFAGLPLVCAASAAALQTRASTVEASCEITEAATPGGLHVEAIVRGPAGALGNYDLAIEKTSAGGTATTSQGGAFTLDGKGTAIVAANDFDAGSLSGTMRANVADEPIVCQTER